MDSRVPPIRTLAIGDGWTNKSGSSLQGISQRSASSKAVARESLITVWLRRVFSMRFLLLASFAIPVLGLAVTSYTTTTISIKETTNDLSASILDNIVLRAQEHTLLAFSIAWNITEAVSREVPLDDLGTALQYDFIRKALWKMWQNSNGNVASIYIVYPDGSTVAYVKDPYLLHYFSNQSIDLAFAAEIMDMKTGEVNLSDPNIYLPASVIDLKTSQFWTQRLVSKDQFWTGMLYDAPQGKGQLWDTCVYPINDPVTNETVAWLAVDLSTSSLRDYLRLMHISKNSQVWLMEPKTGLLVASSDINERTYTTDLLSVTYAQDSNIDVIREISTYILNNSDSRVSYEITHRFPGQKVIAHVELLTEHNLQLLLVVAYPENDFLASVNRVQKMIVIISSVAFAVSIAFGLFVIVLITVPLTKLGKRMNEIARGSFDLSDRSHTRLFEIRSLEMDFQRMVNALRSFGRFVPIDIVRFLLRNNTEATAGLHQTKVTVMFSDIVGFTNKVEVMSPSQLSVLLTDYLNAMCAVIGNNKGTVDKFIGDAIMALWNAPTAVKRHAFLACETALQSQRSLEELNVHWTACGLPEIRSRIGIHTGTALVGNLGSEERLAFTAIGDNVNLASRLEALNKKYGTSILISGEVFDLVHSEYLCRNLDVVVVAGKTTPTRLYELVTKLSDASPEHVNICNLQAEAVNCFFGKHFQAALDKLHQLQNVLPHDTSIKLLIERATHANNNIDTLPANWTGHLVLDEK